MPCAGMRHMHSADHKIPVSVIVATRNESARIGRCLDALSAFDEIIVLDSCSSDGTKQIAAVKGARVIDFKWNGWYPKKRQWALDNLSLKHDWVFFVDADEVVMPGLCHEILNLFREYPSCCGYFVRGLYVIDGMILRHGVANNKLCLFDRREMAFPVVDDLDIPGMGEIEGHYQPVFKVSGKTGALKNVLLHHAYEGGGWDERHVRYASWERAINKRNAWPRDPSGIRQMLKLIFRAIPGRGEIAFVHSYIVKLGFLDGAAGLRLAQDRRRYYRMIAN